MTFDEQESKFDIQEFEISEEGRHYDPEARVKIPEREVVYETRRERRRRKKAEKGPKQKKYHWAFFLSCVCFGLIGPVAANAPSTIFLGAGIGFLFFVDPIYERVISIFERED